MRIEVPCTPGRGGFGPTLSLEYSVAGTASPFGRGWNLTGSPAIGIDLRRRSPRYDGTDDLQLGGDEIVPQLVKVAGAWTPRTRRDGDWDIAMYRSRRGGRRTRIERWTDVRTGRVHFRTRDAAGTITVYGARAAAAARIADPEDEARTFSWLPELQIDRYGNALWFEYVAENATGVDRAAPFEPSRAVTTQRYLKRVRYGNARPVSLDEATLAGDDGSNRWHFLVVLDYGDHAGDAPSSVPDRPWPARKDPFTTHRPGFAVRTHRLCRRIAWFHDFDELGPDATEVGALALEYDERTDGAMLRSVQEHGYRRQGTVYATRATPPLVLRYADATPERAFREVPRETHEGFSPSPHGHRFVDLYGEGLPGILTETAGTWLYKPNLGGGRFGAATLVEERPAIRPETFAFGDLDGNGDVEVAQLAGRLAGRFELPREVARWRAFEPFAAFPHVEALGGRAQWVDLNGDGRPDVVITSSDRLIWFPSDGDEFAAPIEVPLPTGAMAAPTATADPSLHLFFADMTGDGVSDLVRIDDGSVTYWPMLGNARFGDAVVMDGAPAFSDSAFDPARLRFVDLDGSGTTDLVYLGNGEIRCWINAAGNRLEPGAKLGGLPHLDSVSGVSVLDFIGDGRPCLVWTNPLPGHDAITYLPLTTELRPRLLVEIDDSRGRLTRLSYASSAAHYLRDRVSTAPWRTRLPSHPIVVDRLEVVDEIGGARSVRRYAYHDGYFDGDEREMRGFGRVDITDTDPAEEGESAPSFSAPSLTRMWFHLGTPMWNHHRPDQTYAGDLRALPPHVFGDAERFGPGETEDGLRALAGHVIRTEVWGLVDGAPAAHPLVVQQRTIRLSLAQPRAGHGRAAFDTVVVDEVTETYEQEGGDPRVTQQCVLATTDFGTPSRTASIAYPRRQVGPEHPAAQTQRRIVVEDHRFVSFDEAERFEIDLPIEVRRLELVGVASTSAWIDRSHLLAPDVTDALADPGPHHVDLVDAGSPRARALGWEQRYYWNADRTGPLPLGGVSSPLLLHHEEAACFAREHIVALFGDRAPAARLTALGYVERYGTWWKRGATEEHAGPSRFYQLVASVADDGGRTTIEHDDYAIAALATTDPVGNRTQSAIDYHTLLPSRVEDPNGAISEVARDPLGVIVAITHHGHVLDAPWGFAALSIAPARTFDEVVSDPAAFVGDVAVRVWYDSDAWWRDRTPVAGVTVRREQLVTDGGGGGAPSSSVGTEITYLDGFGRVLQTRTRMDPGVAIQRDAQDRVVVDGGGRPLIAEAPARWRVSGHVVYDTRQRIGREYEPYFSPTPAFESDVVLQQLGVSTLKRYDALGRLVTVDSPDGSFSRVTYRAWEVEHADANDTVDVSTYRALRESLPSSSPERQALEHARRHANTTRVTYLDPLGRECGTLERGEVGTPDRRVELRLDVEGAQREVIDPRGLVAFRYHRDMRGRPLHDESVDAGPLWTLPDSHDRGAWSWNARGLEYETGFDLAGRPLFVHVRGGDGPTPLDHRVVERAYGDSLPDRQDARRKNLLGRATTLRDSSGESSVAYYDPTGQPLLSERRTLVDDNREVDWRAPPAFAAGTFAVARTFDGLGRPVTDTLPDGTRRRFEYQAGGTVARVLVTTPDGTFTDLPVLQQVEHDARGQRTALRLGNDIDVAFAYDRDTFRLARHTVRRGARRLRDERYTYDPAGNLVRIEDPSQDGPEAIIANAAIGTRRDFTYDAHYRLRTATGRVHQGLLAHDHVPGAAGAFKQSRHLSLNNGAALERYTRTYELDASGNLTSIRHAGTSHSWTTSLWVDPGSNRSLPAADHTGASLTDPGSQFDAAGNLRRLDHLRDMKWNWQNTLERVVVVARADGTDDGERYVYGADRQRVRRISTRVVHGGDIETTEKLYLGDQELLRVSRNGTPMLERWTTHVSDGTQRLAVIHRWTRDDLARETDDIARARIRYQLADHQGSATLELDEAAQIISYEEHVPYGGTSVIAGDSVREVSLKDYRYAGKERDDATGLDYYGHRYYAPWMGRWLSPDPIGPEDALNLYQFVRGDPVSHVDPTGLYTESRRKHVDAKSVGEAVGALAAAGTILPSARASNSQTSTNRASSPSASTSAGPAAPPPSSTTNTSDTKPTPPASATDEIGTDEDAMRADASPPAKRLDPWDNSTRLPIDPDHPDAYQLPEQTISMSGEKPLALPWAYRDPEGYLQSLKGEHQWAETRRENQLRHLRFETLRVLMLEHGYPRSETREKIEAFGDRFVLERYGYEENDGRRASDRQDNQNRIIEAVNRYMDDFAGPGGTQPRMGNADAADRAEAQTKFHALWFEGQQYVNQSLLAAVAGGIALRLWEDPEDQSRITGTVGFFGTVESLGQQHMLVGAGSKPSRATQETGPFRSRERSNGYFSANTLSQQDPHDFVTIYRFADRSSPSTLLPRLSSAPWHTRLITRIKLLSPTWRARQAEAHMRGFVADPPSAFVSALLDVAKGASTTDPWLHSIIHGIPRIAGVEKAPDLGVFLVPRSKLVYPNNELSSLETEVLFLGSDLRKYISEWRRNPY